MKTTLDFASKSLEWLRDNKLSKPYEEIWYELRGGFVKTLQIEPRKDIGSLITSRTFRPPSNERHFVFSQLSKNIEAACARARRHRMRAAEVSFYLKTQAFTYHGRECRLVAPTNMPNEIITALKPHFDAVFRPDVLYRATGITLYTLVEEEAATLDLFGTSVAAASSEVFKAVDQLNRKYGRRTVYLGSSLTALAARADTGSREKHTRVQMPRAINTKTLDVPFLGKAR